MACRGKIRSEKELLTYIMKSKRKIKTKKQNRKSKEKLKMRKLLSTRLIAIVLAILMLIGLGTAALGNPNLPPAPAGPFSLSVWHLLDATGTNVYGTPQGQAPTAQGGGALTPVIGTNWRIDRVNDTPEIRAAIEALIEDQWPSTNLPAGTPVFVDAPAAHAAIQNAVITGPGAYNDEQLTGNLAGFEGRALFNGGNPLVGIPAGIYVVRQQALVAGDPLHLPFLVSVPMYVVTDAAATPPVGEWVSHVHAFPKAPMANLDGAVKNFMPALSAGNTITWEVTFGIQPGFGQLGPVPNAGGAVIRIEDALSSHLLTGTGPPNHQQAIADSIVVQFLNVDGQWQDLPRGAGASTNWQTSFVATTPIGTPTYWPNSLNPPTAAGQFTSAQTLVLDVLPHGRTTMTGAAPNNINLAALTNFRVQLTATVDPTVAAGVTIPNAARIHYGPNPPVPPIPPDPVQTFNLEIRKVNASGNLLPGARFRIYDQNNIVYIPPVAPATEGTWIPRPANHPGAANPAQGVAMTFAVPDQNLFLTTGANTAQPNVGIINIPGLQAGRYVIVEEVAPQGYILNPEPMTFEINLGLAPSPNYVRSVSVLNSPDGPGFQLPLTGGAGTILFTIIGLTLIGGSIVLLVAVRKRSK